MKLVLDACVLFPTVMREMLIGAAAHGAYQPLWSARLLEEWARAAERSGSEVGATARMEIALLRSQFPAAEIPADLALEDTLSLPDENDRHVLATAILGGAAAIVTRNASDFPTRSLGRHGLLRFDPDAFLLDLMAEGAPMADIARAVQARAEAVSGRAQPLRPLLKRTGLPRLGKALS